MTKQVHFRRDFVWDLGDGRTKTYPSGWRGQLDDEIAQSAIDGGYTRTAPATTAAEAPEADEPAADESMTRDELDQLAQEYGLDPDDYRTKADIAKAINAA